MFTRRHWLAALGAAIAVIMLVLSWGPIAGWAAGFFGFESGGGDGAHYLFWSGAGSDAAYLSMVGAAVLYYRKQNCRRHWCPFLGHYDFQDPATGVVHKLCWLHHPDVRHRSLKSEHIEGIQDRREADVAGPPTAP